MEKRFGVEPDLHPSSGEWQRYTRFVARGSNRSHFKYTDTSAATQGVYEAFKSIRKGHQEFGKKLARRSEEHITRNLTFQLLSAETDILDKPNGTLWRAGAKNQNQYQERLKSRVESGRSSYLYYYGREGNTTGFEEFDQMYSELWSVVENTGPNGYLSSLVEQHRLAVLDTELRFLGRTTILAAHQPLYV